jgi:hypothetical protein
VDIYKETTATNDDKRKIKIQKYYDHHDDHHHKLANMDLGHLLTRSALTLPAALCLIYLKSKRKWKQQQINYNEKITASDKDVS